MPAHIKTEPSGETSAFTADGTLVMNYGRPHVAWGFAVTDLEDWLTTLEETMPAMPACHRYILEKLYFSLKAAHNRHKREHDDVISDAPSEDDLMSYLTSYSAAMTWETMEGKK
jgi:aminopeptidase-like protein